MSIEELFRRFQPAKEELERMRREADMSVRWERLSIPEFTPKPPFDYVESVRWFDQLPTDDLMRTCGHA